MYALLPRHAPAPADRKTDGEAPARAARPAMLPPAALRYAAAPLQRRESAGGIGAAENEAVRSLTAGRVDLHALGATVRHVPATDPRLTAVGARSLTRGRHALVGNAADRGHELWHMAQQAMGRVRSTGSIAGQPLNAQPSLEREADHMGSLIARRSPPLPAGTAQARSSGPVNNAAPIQRQVTKFVATTDKRLPPTADLLKSLDYTKFTDDEDDVVEKIEDTMINPKKTATVRPKQIKASISPNGLNQSKIKRAPHKSGVVGKIGTDNYFLRSKSKEVFEGGHLIPHELWTDKDPQKSSADDYVNLVPMSRTMNVGDNDHTWRAQEQKMLHSYNIGNNFKVTIDINTPDVQSYTYGRIGELFGLGIEMGEESDAVSIKNWLPKTVNIAEDTNLFSAGTAYENQILNVHGKIDDGPGLVAVLKSTNLWDRCDPDLQEAIEDL